jgi:SAM-dependent methyltransferase
MSDNRTQRAAFFQDVYERNLWLDEESVSGVGSNIEAALPLIDALPPMFEALRIRSFLDIPCGDFNWMKAVPFGDIAYIGGDLVPALVARNTERFGTRRRRFEVIDLVEDRLPDADMVFVRDCLIHMENALVFRALRNICRTAFRYVCLTHEINHDRFPGGENVELERAVNGVNFEFRPNDFELPPFSFPPPIQVIEEGEVWTPWGGKKTMAVWSEAQVRAALAETPEPTRAD